ncbi:polyprenol monophosphomannose synthase [Candidatus Dojkabacteria bacterium]|nr:polyprenol monophosphomannose synthase [Candidatus Dojkabacteria bacterium]
MKKTTLVIPTFNEKENIGPLLERIQKVSNESLKDLTELSILFVDDSSPDGTQDEIRREAEKYTRDFEIDILSREEKTGLGTAYIAGFKKAIARGADYIVQMDGDLSHEPEVVSEMIKALKTHDFVIGSRYIKGGQLPKWSFVRKMISKGGNLYSRIILGFNVRDYTGGFNGYQRKVLETIKLDEIKSNGYAFQIEMKYRAKKAGFKFLEIPIHFRDRTHGSSKFSRNIFIEALINTLRLKFTI